MFNKMNFMRRSIVSNLVHRPMVPTFSTNYVSPIYFSTPKISSWGLQPFAKISPRHSSAISGSSSVEPMVTRHLEIGQIFNSEDDTDDELIEDVNLTLALAAAKANVDVVAEKRKQRDAERCEWRKARRLHHVFAPRGMYMSASRERRVFHESHVFSDDESPDNAMEEHSATRRECDATKESTTTRQ